MKLSFVNGRCDTTGRHNDRNFDVTKAPHINLHKIEENKYYTYNGETDKPFREIELDFYKQTYKEYIDNQARRYIKDGHKSRSKTLSQYYSNSRTQPEDLIIQIGNRDEHISGDKLWEVALEYVKQFDEAYGKNCKVLTMALHMDEETPHVHIRRAWMCKHPDGSIKPSMSGAFAEMGIPIKDTSMPQSKVNTPQVTFTQIDKLTFREICDKKGIKLEPEPEVGSTRRKHLSVSEYKDLMDDLTELRRQYASVENDLKQIQPIKEEIMESVNEFEEFLTSEVFQSRFLDEIKNARKKGEIARIRAVMEIYKQEMSRIIEAGRFTTAISEAQIRQQVEREYHGKISSLKDRCNTLERRNDTYKNFIMRHDMASVFNEEYKQEKESSQENSYESKEI